MSLRLCRAVQWLSKYKNSSNSRKLTGEFNKHIENKGKKLGGSNILLTTNNQYINDFVKKLTIYIIDQNAHLHDREAQGRV